MVSVVVALAAWVAFVPRVAGGVDADAVPDVSVTKLTDGAFGFPDCTALVSQQPTFRFTRTDTTGTLDVSITTSGSAVAGQDYTPPPATVSFSSGVATVDLVVDGAPSAGFLVPARARTLTITVVSGGGYNAGSPSSADASITYFVPGPCPPAMFASLPVNQFQAVSSNRLPEPLVINAPPPGTAFVYFTHPTYPPEVPQSWLPPPGLGWYYQGPVPNQFAWYWSSPGASIPVAMAPGAYSFDVIACAYYQAIAIYYGPASGVESSSCTTITFNLNVLAAVTGVPTFTG